MNRVQAEVDFTEVRAPRGPTTNTIAEDEDDLLYGESAPNLFSAAAAASVSEPLTSTSSAAPVLFIIKNYLTKFVRAILVCILV